MLTIVIRSLPCERQMCASDKITKIVNIFIHIKALGRYESLAHNEANFYQFFVFVCDFDVNSSKLWP